MSDPIDFNNAPLQSQPGGKDHTRLLLIKSLLNQNSLSFVKWLFPAAIIKHGEARVGDIYGSPGESLQITLMGDLTGVWIDHADNEMKGGDFVSLYARAEGLDQRAQFPKIMDDLEGWLGIHKKERAKSAKQAAREAQGDKPNPAAEPLGAPTGTWHYFDENSDIIATVYRYDLSNGGKTYRPWDAKTGRTKPPETRPLYNLPGILNSEPIVLVEGEKCADALIGFDYAATSAMGGAYAPVNKTDWTAIKGKRVILWPDADIPGQKWLATVSGYLRQIGCKVSAVQPPDGVKEGWDAADAVAEGLDVKALIDAAAQPSQSSTRFKFLSLEDLDGQEAPEWRIDQYLPSNGLALLYGASGSFKSFIAIDVAAHLAHGLDWCGRHTQKCGVAYIAAEGGFGINKRIKAWHKSHTAERAKNFFVLPTAVDLLDPKADIDQLINDMEFLRQHELGIVIIDTLARSFFGGDENAAKDMNAFIANCDRIRQAFGCLILLIHHSGKDEVKGARGSSSLRAAMDTEMRIKRMGTSNQVSIFCTKQKEAEEAGPINMDVVGVELVDLHGEISKSAVVRPLDSPLKAKKFQGANEKAILKVLTGESDGVKHKELVRKTNIDRGSLNKALRSLKAAGLIAQNQIGDWVSSEVFLQEILENDEESID